MWNVSYEPKVWVSYVLRFILGIRLVSSISRSAVKYLINVWTPGNYYYTGSSQTVLYTASTRCTKPVEILEEICTTGSTEMSNNLKLAYFPWPVPWSISRRFTVQFLPLLICSIQPLAEQIDNKSTFSLLTSFHCLRYLDYRLLPSHKSRTTCILSHFPLLICTGRWMNITWAIDFNTPSIQDC